MTPRGTVDVEDLLRIALLLVVAWLALEVLGALLDVLGRILGALRPLVALAIVALAVYWLLARR